MMSLNRDERRYFAIAFLNFINNYFGKGYEYIIRRNILLNQIGFVFFYYPKGSPLEKIKQLMLIAAEGYALYLNYRTINFIVVGITENEKFHILHVNLSDFRNKDQDELKRILNYLGWFDEKYMQYVKIDFNKKQNNS
ncbi:MAG: hypothetical protein ACO1OF_11790 [Adhaeribacter sp.]